MYCPICAAQNIEGARFCRNCGADISLVPQALTGRLPLSSQATEFEDEDEGRGKKRRGKKKKPPTIEDAVKEAFVGLAFLTIFICGALFFRGGFFMWFWAIIPALACLGEGVGKWARLRQEERRQLAAAPSPDRAPFLFRPATQAGALPPRDTSPFADAPPTSITESTTRHLGVAGSSHAPSPAASRRADES